MHLLRSFAVVVLSAGTVLAADWPQFRGPAGTGVADAAAKPPTKLGPKTNVKWSVPVPPGISSPVVVGEKLFLTAFEKEKLYTIAYSTTNGAELWRREAPAKTIEPFHKIESSPAASTPVSDGERLVVYFGSCGLLAYDLDGKELWRFELPCAETNMDFGTGTSPVIADGLVVLQRDLAKNSKLLAVDLKTGSLVWEKAREGFTSYGTPCIWKTPEGTLIVAGGATRLKAYDLKTGAEKWVLTGMPAVPCTTPVVSDGRLVYAAWAPGTGSGKDDFKMPTFDDLLKGVDEDKDGVLSKAESAKSFLKDFFDGNDTNKDGKLTRDEWDASLKFLAAGKNVALAIEPGASGEVAPSKIAWKVTKGLPYVPSPLVYDGYMYTINMQGRLAAHEVKTGKEAYLDEQVGLTNVYASPVAANGHIYLCGVDRSLVVMKAGDVPEKVSSTKLDDRIAATPAIVGDTLYVRTGKTLFAFAEKKSP